MGKCMLLHSWAEQPVPTAGLLIKDKSLQELGKKLLPCDYWLCIASDFLSYCRVTVEDHLCVSNLQDAGRCLV